MNRSQSYLRIDTHLKQVGGKIPKNVNLDEIISMGIKLGDLKKKLEDKKRMFKYYFSLPIMGSIILAFYPGDPVKKAITALFPFLIVLPYGLSYYLDRWEYNRIMKKLTNLLEKNEGWSDIRLEYKKISVIIHFQPSQPETLDDRTSFYKSNTESVFCHNRQTRLLNYRNRK